MKYFMTKVELKREKVNHSSETLQQTLIRGWQYYKAVQQDN